jgi:hypothetical protein
MRPILVDAVFAELDPTIEAQANEHLLSCEACREEEGRLLALREAGRGRPIEPGGALRSRIEASLPQRDSAHAAGGLRRPVPAYVAVAAAAAGALAVALLPVRELPRVDRGPERGPSAGVEVRDGQLPFVIADSYDTRVARATHPDSAPVRSGQQDSL